MTPNKPRADPKISIINIETNNEAFCASAIAHDEPTIPTQTPQNKLERPTVNPEVKIAAKKKGREK